MAEEIKFEDFKQQWLEEVQAGKPSTTELGHRFGNKLMMNWLDIEDDVSDNLLYCDGAGDGGIDIAYLSQGEKESVDVEPEGDIWYLVQSKYGSAFQGNNTLLHEASKVIETLDGRRSNLSSLAQGLLEKLTYFRRNSSPRDRIVLMFATEAPLSNDQTRIMDDIQAMGRNRLGSLFEVAAISIYTIYKRLEEKTAPDDHHLVIPIGLTTTSTDDSLLIGSVSLLNLYSFMKKYRDKTQDLDKLYEKNVRRFLGSGRKVNKAMTFTLENTPERFGLFNNGITIVASDIRPKGEDLYELVDPYVVNGCQTTKSIWQVCDRRLESGGTGNDPKLVDWKDRATRGVVVTKIVKVGENDDVLQQEITRYTNSQNAVSEKDFLALSSGFKTWADQMRKKYHVFLEIQRGEWDSQRALQKQKPSLEQYKEYANAFDLLKVYGSGWMRESGNAFGRNSVFLPKGSVFVAIFDKTVPDFGLDDLYAAYLLQKAADEIGFGRGVQNISRRQTRFLFYQVTIEMLRDILVRAGLKTDNSSVTQALIKLFKPENQTAQKALLDTALEVIDEYMTSGKDETVFNEPAYKERYNNDLNSFLKWEQLGKTKDSTPRLIMLLEDYQRSIARGKPSPREVITEAIK